MSQTINDLLNGNEAWKKGVVSDQPDFFENMAKGQSPKFLWIGCADSRVPASVITKSKPGSIFVQRNVANMVIPTDMNLITVTNYAVHALGVEHIIICGHYGCGGVQAAMGSQSLGILDPWLSHIKQTYVLNKEAIDSVQDEKEKFNKYVELNVKEQVKNMARISFVQEAWRNGKSLTIHGWVFDLATGGLKDLNLDMNSAESLEHLYQYT